MTMKKALITGITGQDGAYLARFLLSKGYQVWGMVRRASSSNLYRIEEIKDKINLVYGDVTDGASIMHMIKQVEPDEIYNLAAQSDVHASFQMAEYTANVDAIGPLRILEAIRILELENKTKLYQASTSELYGQVQSSPQNEQTPFQPRSPYAAAKLYAYWAVVNYRDAYGIFACNGILFNHESPMRGNEFVTRKITKGAAAVYRGQLDKISLGNLNAKRDWGHARDYVESMWLMLQANKPDDFVIATGETYSVREFVELAFDRVGITIQWQGQGVDKIGINAKTGNVIVDVDPKYFRPTDVDCLCGDPTKAKDILGWSHRVNLPELVAEMVDADLKSIE